MRVCLDTNVLISGIFWRGIPGRIIDLWIENRFDLVATLSILDEYRRILKRIEASTGENVAEKWIKILVEKLIMVIPLSKPKKWSRDVHDDQFIQCSLSANVDYLVTGDKDLLELSDPMPFSILKPKVFLDKLN